MQIETKASRTGRPADARQAEAEVSARCLLSPVPLTHPVLVPPHNCELSTEEPGAGPGLRNTTGVLWRRQARLLVAPNQDIRSDVMFSTQRHSCQTLKCLMKMPGSVSRKLPEKTISESSWLKWYFFKMRAVTQALKAQVLNLTGDG